MEKLPFLITVPHGGTLIPDEVKTAACITAKDLFDDSDSFTNIIYEASNHIEAEITFDIARAFIDVSRAEGALPPEWTDGVIKNATCYMRPIYKAGHEPDANLVERLLEKYYRPFHTSIKKALADTKIKIALDCHSMAAIAPAIAPDTGKRPLFNLGDLNGSACDPRVTELLKECFIEAFELEEWDVAINQPFKGGYIARTYGNKPKPWIQIEMNRSLYLSKQWFNSDTLDVETKRLQELNRCFLNVLNGFHKKIIQNCS